MSDIVLPQNYDRTASLIRRAGNIDLATAARFTPATFASVASNGRWQPARHLLYISTEIAAALAKGNARIIVNMPPRHGKTEFLSIYTAAWWLDTHPQDPIILAMYNSDLATKNARRVRDMFLQPLNPNFAFKAKVREDVKAADQFMTTEGGGMSAVGLGGTATGLGAKLFMVDDYVKNAVEAASEANQKMAIDWFKSVAYTRMEPGGNIIILATRWNLKDLVGRVIKQVPGQWKVINLPALALENDPLGRAPGEALWPERYSRERLLDIKATIGNYFWSSLYQGKPTTEDELAFQNHLIKIVDVFPHTQFLRYVRAWDFAGTEGGGDWSVGTLMASDNVRPRFGTWIDHVIRKQYATNKLEQLVRATAHADGVDIPIVIEQDPGASGKAYAEYIRDTVLKGFSCEIVPAQKNKVLKAAPLMAAVEDGRLNLRRAEWNRDWLGESDEFPGGTHDDQVDSAAIGYNYLHRHRATGTTWGRRGTAATNSMAMGNTGQDEEYKSSGGTEGRRISRLTFGRR